MRRALMVMLVGIVLALAAPRIVPAACETFENSRARMSDGEIFCGGTGGTCTECTNYDQGGNWTSCFLDSRGFMICSGLNGGGPFVF